MGTGTAVAVFLGCLLLAIAASAVLAHRIDQAGLHLGLSEGLLGLLTALAADSPEIASAVSAVVSGRGDLGAAVILGSNIFNLAVLFGLGALVAGRIGCGREALLLDAGVAMWVSLAIAAQLLFATPPWADGLLIGAVALPYVAISTTEPATLRLPAAPGYLVRWLRRATRSHPGGDPRTVVQAPHWADWLSIVPLLSCVVLSSYGMVQGASVLGSRFGVPDIVLGTLVLATLTGIPNAVAAIRLALARRGEAVVSETFNSNTLNLLAGIYLPSLLAPSVPLSPFGRLTLYCLLGATALATLLFLRRRGLGRWEGAVLLAGYIGFAGFVATR